MDVNPVYDRPDDGSGKDTEHGISHDGGHDSAQEMNASHVQPNPVQRISLREMYQFSVTFRIKRGALSVSREEVCSALQERYSKNISPMWIAHFENLGVFYENMCQVKSLLERWMDGYDTTQTPDYWLLNSGMGGDLSNENMGSRSDEDKTHQTSQEEKDTKRNISLGNESTERNKPQMMSLEEMKNFVSAFQKRKLDLALSQEDVCLQLSKMTGRCIPLEWISEFERFNAFFEEMCELKPVLEELPNITYELKKVITEPNPKLSLKTFMSFGITERPNFRTVSSMSCLTPATTQVSAITVPFAPASTARDFTSSTCPPCRQVTRTEPVRGHPERPPSTLQQLGKQTRRDFSP